MDAGQRMLDERNWYIEWNARSLIKDTKQKSWSSIFTRIAKKKKKDLKSNIINCDHKKTIFKSLMKLCNLFGWKWLKQGDSNNEKMVKFLVIFIKGTNKNKKKIKIKSAFCHFRWFPTNEKKKKKFLLSTVKNARKT